MRETRARLRWFVGAVVAAQVAVPVVALIGEPPTRLGFQMYSGEGSYPKITVVEADGTARAVPLNAVAAKRRVEVDWLRYVPGYLCDTMPDVVEVRLTKTDPPAARSVSCGR